MVSELSRRKTVFSVCLCFCLFLFCGPSPLASASHVNDRPTDAAAGSHVLPPEHLPIVLVPSVFGDAPAVWTHPGTKRKPTLYDELATTGWRPEQTLFSLRRTTLDERGFDVDAASLRSMIMRAHELSGGLPVDIIAHGEGALVVKAAIDGHTPVRNVIAICPPHRGSDLVHNLRLAYEQEGYLGGTTGGGRATEIVDRRARSVFEPLYHEYVISHVVGASAVPDRFEQWLSDSHPDRYREMFKDGQWLRPGPGLLTAAYYDHLSLNAARYRYVYGEKKANQSKILGWLRPIEQLVDPIFAVVLGGLGQAVTGVTHRGANWWRLLSRAVRPAVVNDVTAERLIPDQIEIPGGSLRANDWLSRLNEAFGRPARWVTFAAPGRGGGDGLVELDRARAPLEDDDMFILFVGPGATGHHEIMSNRRLWETIGRYLSNHPGAEQFVVDPGFFREGTVTLHPGAVQYLDLTAGGSMRSAGELRIGVEIPRAASGAAWVDVWTADGVDRRMMPAAGYGWLGLSIDRFGSEVIRAVVGFRPGPDDPVTFRYELEFSEADQTGQPEDGPTPRIVVERSTKRTTLRQPENVHHKRWEWDFGDGQRLVVDGSDNAALDLVHPYDRPGTYRVTARSIDNTGSQLRENNWTVNIPPEDSGPPYYRMFTGASVADPSLSVTIEGPSHWIAGRPASYRVRVVPDWPPGVIRQTVDIDPGAEFEVQWPRPMDYDVVVAVTVTRTYRFDDGEMTVRHVSLHTRPVRVLGTSLGD